ncbi:MAG: AAA family ATPase, partial [Planctomycetes bacterium]|nr:AAA family ATPase [Planctomycetota bacterium]
MIDVDLQALLGSLDGVCTRAMEAGAGQSVSLTNHEVSIEHVLYALLDIEGADLSMLLEHYEIDPGRFRSALLKDIEALRTGAGGRPVFAPLLVELLQDALLMGTVEFAQGKIRSALILIVLLSKGGRFMSVATYDLLSTINEADLRKNALDLCAHSAEAAIAGSDTGSRGGAPVAQGDALEKFCINFTQQARDGKIDPVFGRDNEIRQMIDILARRRKNNPIAVGDPGVGKTAVIEGLALRIVEGDVPDMIKDVELQSLDLGLLQAGASVKGEFEKRLQGVIDEVKSSPTPIILFIDEAHTLIGAGNAAGGGDAANLLKPALAR